MNKVKEAVKALEDYTADLKDKIKKVEQISAQLEKDVKKQKSDAVISQVEPLLISFGNYLLSEERKEGLVHEENEGVVTHADIANWKDKAG